MVADQPSKVVEFEVEPVTEAEPEVEPLEPVVVVVVVVVVLERNELPAHV